MEDKDKIRILADIKKPSPKKCPKSESGEHCYHDSCMDGLEKNNCQHPTRGRNSKCEGLFDVCCMCSDHREGKFFEYENYPPHIIYTDENLKKLNFRQINDEFNQMLEYALGTSLCPKCGYVTWLNGDGGNCNAQGRPESKNEIVIKYFDLWEEDKEEEAMKLLLKNPEVIRDNFYWECHTCHTQFISKVVWKVFEGGKN